VVVMAIQEVAHRQEAQIQAAVVVEVVLLPLLTGQQAAQA